MIGEGEYVVARLYFITPAQFSPVLVCSDDLANRLVDAKHWAGVAGAGTDSQRLAAWPGGCAASSADPTLLAFRGGLCRPLAQTARLACDPIGVHDPGAAPLGA